MVAGNFAEVMLRLKEVLKVRKVTYGALADRLNISESAVKKIFNGSDCSYGRLAQICEAIDVTLTDLLSSLETTSPHKFRLTHSQEELFESEAHCFELYWRLVFERQDRAVAQQKMGMSDSETLHCLVQLDRVNLLRFLPGGILQLPAIRFIEWDLETPFIYKLIRSWAKRTFEDGQSSEVRSRLLVQYFQLLPSSADEFRQELKNLETEYARRTVREMNLNRKQDLTEIRFVAATAGGSFVT
ncbi:MAG: helix-turn-helix transcriptional regulator [Proteobacteria bacterium]|nr:helix-turn-helix transcriptional regulator [Pseudomonadota bacterium]